MKTKEIELLLRRAKPLAIPLSWKEEILAASQTKDPSEKTDYQSFSKSKYPALFPRLAWCAIAACWGVIFFLHATTPTPSPGALPFDSIAYAQREAFIQRLACTEQQELSYDEPSRPKASPLQVFPPGESIFRLRAPHSFHLLPTTPRA